MSATTEAHAITPSSNVQLRTCEPTDFPHFHARMNRTFTLDDAQDDRDMDATIFEPDRSLIAVDGGQIIATASATTRTITVPGAAVPVAAVQWVSVAPTHRRRGILTAMMRKQLDTLHHEQREPIAALCAAEAGIYGRFGYGLATRHTVMTGETPFMNLTSRPSLTDLRIREATLEDARLTALYDRVRLTQVAWLDRPGPWWTYKFHVPEHQRDGQTTPRAIICEESTGEPCGYAVYRLKYGWTNGPASEVLISEVVAVTPLAYAAAWHFLLNLDWVRHVRRDQAPVDEPLQYLLADPRSVQLAIQDGVWVRLVDIDRALAMRRYSTDVDVVIAVEDPFCPWNEGKWRLSGSPAGAECTRTRSPADLAITAGDLGAAYLGSTTLLSLASAGRVEQHRAGSLTAVSRALRSDAPVFCPDHF